MCPAPTPGKYFIPGNILNIVLLCSHFHAPIYLQLFADFDVYEEEDALDIDDNHDDLVDMERDNIGGTVPDQTDDVPDVLEEAVLGREDLDPVDDQDDLCQIQPLRGIWSDSHNVMFLPTSLTDHVTWCMTVSSASGDPVYGARCDDMWLHSVTWSHVSLYLNNCTWNISAKYQVSFTSILLSRISTASKYFHVDISAGTSEVLFDEEEFKNEDPCDICILDVEAHNNDDLKNHMSDNILDVKALVEYKDDVNDDSEELDDSALVLGPAMCELFSRPVESQFVTRQSSSSYVACCGGHLISRNVSDFHSPVYVG